MILVNPVEPDRIDITIEGSITKEEMQTFLTELNEVANGMEAGHMLIEVSDFHWPSLGAIAFELTHIGEFLKAYKHFERAALICDKQWIRTVAEWEGHLLPWFDICSFTADDHELALNWLKYGDRQQAA